MEIKQHQLYSYMDKLYEEIPDDLCCSIAQEAHIDLVKVNCEVDLTKEDLGKNGHASGKECR